MIDGAVEKISNWLKIIKCCITDDKEENGKFEYFREDARIWQNIHPWTEYNIKFK